MLPPNKKPLRLVELQIEEWEETQSTTNLLLPDFDFGININKLFFKLKIKIWKNILKDSLIVSPENFVLDF